MEHQLVDYGHHLQDLVEDLVVRDVTESAPALRPPTPGPRRGWMVAAAAFVAPLLVIGGVALLLRSAGGEEPVGTGDAPTTIPTTVTEPTLATTIPTAVTSTPPVTPGEPVAAVEEPPSSWTPVDAGDLVGGTAATGPTGMVAMGTNTPSEGNTWFSEDGENWLPLAVPPGRDVAYGDPGFVICCHATGALGATASSFSPDGLTWFTPPIDLDRSQPPEPGTYESMTAVTFGNGKFVAVGEIIEIDDRLEEARSFGVWRTDDGQNWTVVPQDDLWSRCPPDCGTFDVTFGHAGFVVVGVGTWHSSDGTTWMQSQGPRFGDSWGCCSSVAYLNGAYFTIGGAEAQDEPRDAIWRSTDGVSWEEVLVNPDWGDIADVVYGDRGYLAVGWSGDTGAAVWHSTDGMTWTGPNRDSHVFTDTWFHAVGYIDGRYVIFGEANGADPQYGRIFISD